MGFFFCSVLCPSLASLRVKAVSYGILLALQCHFSRFVLVGMSPSSPCIVLASVEGYRQVLSLFTTLDIFFSLFHTSLFFSHTPLPALHTHHCLFLTVSCHHSQSIFFL